MSALAGTISAPFSAASGGIDLGRWLRAAVSLVLALGILAVSLPVAFGSGAPGAGADPLRVFSSSSLVAVDAAGSAQLSVAGIVPGESRAATFRVASQAAGPVSLGLAVHSVDRVGSGGTPLSRALVLRIESDAGRVLYDGPLGAMPRLALGSIDAASARAYRFAVTLPGSAGNGVQGSALSTSFSWNAAS